MPFLELSVEVHRDQAAAAEAALQVAGALAVTLCECAATGAAVLEPSPGETPLWLRLRVGGLFEPGTDLQVVRALLAAALEPAAAATIETRALADRAWEREWLRDFRPMRFGSRLWICPSHEPPPPGAGVVLRLDPGLAFGTGSHPTTALCLNWLDAELAVGGDVLDYGCGSGVLGIAALLLGAHSCVCADHDPQALLAARDNAERNGTAARLQVIAPAALTGRTFDVVLANILAGPLIALAPRLAELTREGGRLVLAGLLQEQCGEVAGAYRPWFDIAEWRRQQGWVCLNGRRRSD